MNNDNTLMLYFLLYYPHLPWFYQSLWFYMRDGFRLVDITNRGEFSRRKALWDYMGLSLWNAYRRKTEKM